MIGALGKAVVKVADAAAPVVDDLIRTTDSVQPTSKLTTKNGVAQLTTPPATRMPKRPKPGISKPEFNKQQRLRVDYARQRVNDAAERVQNIEEANPGVPKTELKNTNPEYKSAVRQYEDALPLRSSEESNVKIPTEDNPYAFPRDTPGAKAMKAEAVLENNQLGRLKEALHQHHLFPKGMSAAIYNRVRKLIDIGEAVDGDVERIADMIEDLTGTGTGDLKKNIKTMSETPHSTFHGEVRQQPSMTFEGESWEISQEALDRHLRKAKNMKELEALLEGFIKDDIIPMIETAKIWENTDDLLRSVSPSYTGKARYKKPKPTKAKKPPKSNK